MVEVKTKLEISPVTINVLVESGLVPVLRQVNGKVYAYPSQQYFSSNRLYADAYADVLEAMRLDGMRPINAPELLDAKLATAEEDPLRNGNHTTSSLLAAGKTRQGAVVYVVAHRNNPLTDPERIRQGQVYLLELRSGGTWTEGPSILTDKEFWALLDMEDGTNSDKKDVYVFTREEANNQFEFGGTGTWSISTGSPLNYSNRFLTALARGEDRKNRLLEALQEYSGLHHGNPQEVYDIGTLNNFKRDAERGANLARFLSFRGFYTGANLVFDSGSVWQPPIFVGVPQSATQKMPSLEEVMGALSGGGLIKPEDTARATELLGPLYAEK